MKSITHRLGVFALAALAVTPFTNLASASAADPGKEALVIGISHYPDAQLAGGDKAPENDCKIMEDALKNRGFNITKLNDGQATRANILNALKSYPPTTTQFVLYYAGQSEADPASGKSCIYPFDSNSAVQASWLSAEDLRAALEAVPAPSRTVILDTKAAGTLMTAAPLKNWVCYCAACKAGQNAAVSQYGGDAPKPRNSPVVIPTFDPFHKPKKPSIESTFTHYLAAAIKQGDQGQTWQQLLDAVATNMQQEIGASQAPDLTPDFVSQRVFFASPFLLARSPVTAPAAPAPTAAAEPSAPAAPTHNAQSSKHLVSLWTGDDGGPDEAKATKMSAADVSAAIKAGADPNAVDANGLTLLLIGTGVHRVEIAKLAIDAHADVNYKNPGVGTALVFAAQKGDVEIVKLLLANGADLTATDGSGLTALAAARADETGKTPDKISKIVALLTAAGEKN